MLEYKNFSFPLNVYSHVLRLDYGDFQYLHYGMFDPGQKDVIVAQEHASRMLASRLPPRPCRILEVGIGLGTTLSRLVQAGYEATGITPDENQILYAKGLHGNGLPVVRAKFEDFIDGRTFDLIIFQESAQYIDTATLFQKASSLLNGDGRIIIMDEVSLRKDSPSGPVPPLLDGYLSLGEKFGFDIDERLDLTAFAAPTNAYILDAVTRHRARLIQDLDLASTEIDGLLKSAKAYGRKYKEGLYGYCLLGFKKKPADTPKWLADWASPADEAGLLALFRRAFGSDMPQALWRWKYQGLDPCGALARRDGRVVAFYGGIPRAVSLFGAPATAVQIGDVMVEPKERGVLMRRGPFFLAASHYLRHCVGVGKTFPLAFGFPSQRPYRLGERLGLYAKVGEIMRIDWSALKAWPNPLLRTRPLDATMGAAADRLWLEMAAALSRQIVGVRDFAYLKRRYFEHPIVIYRVFMVSSRLKDMPFGIIVVRDEGEELELVDVVAPPERLVELVKIARRLAWNLGKPKAYTWITAQNAPLFAGKCGMVSPTEIIVPALNWNQGMAPAEICDRWWLMAGDTDFR